VFLIIFVSIISSFAWGNGSTPLTILSLSKETYYAAPKGQGDGSSANKPFVVARFWDKAQSGDMLVLLDGTYAGAECMIKPPKGLSGTKKFPDYRQCSQ